jgi:hypothetical protein
MKKILILSHRRSGTGLLYKTLQLNFNAEYVWAGGAMPCIHGILDGTTLNVLMSNYNCVQIVRDGRDVLVSNYRYWLNGEESNKRVNLNGVSFTDFIRGRGNVSIDRCPMVNMHLCDPPGFWARHTHWFNKVFTIKYDDLVSVPQKIIMSIKEKFGLNFKHDSIKVVSSLTGRNPGKGVVGNWKNYFSAGDLEYFWTKAGVRMSQLQYKK